MTNDVKFSVVIPLYNKEKYIYDCLMSVANQDYTASEIIVINDGSTDDSLIVINKLEQNISNLVVVNQKNGGEAVARNTGIKKTRYEYIVFLDADDFWLPNHLSQINQLIHEYPDCELFCSQYCAIMRNHKKKEMRLPIINGTHMRVSNYFDYLYNPESVT